MCSCNIYRTPCDKLTNPGKVLRGDGMGTASIFSLAEIQSVEHARAELAAQMLTHIQSSTDMQYLQLLGKQEVEEEISAKTKIIIGSVCETIVAGAFIDCQKSRKNKQTGMYSVYTNVQMSWEEAMKQAKRLLKKELG